MIRCLSTVMCPPRLWRGDVLTRCRRWTSTTSEISEIPAGSVEIDAPRGQKIQIAVIGSGPSGCYVADYLTKKNPNIHVDIYEKLPVPFGLLRYGVAPDHPEVKNLETKFKEMFRTKRVTWLGNMDVGRSIPLKTMLEAYTAVVMSTGANKDKMLHIPGEDLGNVFGAREFVNYYNTYPSPHGSPTHCPFQFHGGQSGGIRDAVIVGNGNVAVDVARVLSSSYKYWCETDMNGAAIKELVDNRIRHLHIVARRGVEHSAFTIAEFRELTKFDSKNEVNVDVEAFNLDDMLALPSSQNRAKKRLLELVHKFTARGKAAAVPQAQDSGGDRVEDHHRDERKPSKLDRGPCTISFRYHLRPVAFVPHPQHRGMVGGVRFEATQPVPEGADPADPTYVVIPCQVAFKSIGYASEPIRDVPFDQERSIVANDHGRVRGRDRLYCSGWCKRGATGVILHTMADAHATAQAILDDLENRVVKQTTPQLGKYALLDYFIEKQLYPISINALERIWNVEVERGIDLGKRSEKVAHTEDMLEIAMGGKVGKRAHNRVRGISNGRPDALMYLDELLDDDTDMREFAKKFSRELPSLMDRDAVERGLNMKALRG